MHELSITQEIVNTVEEARAGAGAHLIVTAVRLKIGRFTAVVPDYVRYYFEMLTENTLLAGAEVDIEILPVIARCRGCGREFEPDGPIPNCPHCGATAADIIQGRELLVDAIEVDEPDNDE
jgi:hydrogenase nickel incorporation protein HypA/HybF